LVLNYSSDTSASQTAALVNELEALFSVRCLAVQADIGSPTGAAILINVAGEYFTTFQNGRLEIDIVVNNAGVASNSTVQDFKVDKFEWMSGINVLGPLLLMQAALLCLPSDGSDRVVNVSSISSTEGFVGQSVYGGTKAALEAMTRTWSRELAENCTVTRLIRVL
jgi:3-oxoacyl-[acyl-carrier protein] reductase